MNILPLLLIAAQAPAAPEPFVVRAATLAVRVDYAAPALSGSIAYELVNWTDRPARQVSFLVHRLMDVTRVTDAASRSLRYTHDVVCFTDDPMRQVTQVLVQLGRPVPAGGTASVRLEYGGYLTGYTEIGWLYVKDHIDTAFTIIRADALAFPVVGGTNDAANRRQPFTDFTYDASVTVPAQYVVATGGAGVRTANADGTATWRYLSGAPSPFLNIAIARFDTLSSDGVRIFYFPGDSSGAQHLMASAQTGLRTLTGWFGERGGSANLAIIEIPDGWGSQASAVGGIIQTVAAFRDTARVGELYHELTHLWNAKELENPPPRWNEGLATFLEALMQERLNGWTGRPDYYRRRISGLRTAVAQDSMLRRTPFLDYGKQRMTGASYRVGDLMFAIMYDLVGAERFNQIVGGYYRDFRSGGTTRDFVNYATRIDAQLSALFDDWLLSTNWTQRLNAQSVSDLVAEYRKP